MDTCVRNQGVGTKWERTTAVSTWEATLESRTGLSFGDAKGQVASNLPQEM